MKNFFSANKSSTGAGVFFSFNSKDGSIYLKLIKQTGWNPSTNKGVFKGGKFINVKMDANEAGGLIRAIRTDGAFNAFHSFEGENGKESTTIKFNYYETQGSEGRAGRQGFGLAVKRGDDEFKVAFTLASAESLSEYLRFALDRIHQADYAKDKEEFKQGQERKAKQQKPTEPEQVEEPEGDPSPEDPAEDANTQSNDDSWP